MYLTVLGASTLVMVVGLAAVLAVRIERRSSTDAADLVAARFYARSAVEMGLYHVADDPAWRLNFPNGVWLLDRPIGHGTFTLEGIDPLDGDLLDVDTDPLDLIGIGQAGQARYKLRVRLEADPVPLSCLETSLHAGTDLIFQEPCTVNGEQIVSANNTIQAVGSVTVNPAMEAVNGFSGTLGPGSTTAGVPPRKMPDPLTVTTDYVLEGTPIAITSLPLDTELNAVMENVLLSPTSNPYGLTTNARGVYVIDCLGTNLIVRNSRIVGTLVVLNPGAGSAVEGSINWDPANWNPDGANYPSLLVSGSMALRYTADTLSESQVGVDYNADGDQDDTYPSRIRGLVYASGNITTAGNVTIEGVLVVGGTLSGTGTLSLTYRSTYRASPPAGFTDAPRMTILPGSWEQQALSP